MLADEGVVEAELVRQHDDLAILLQRLRPVAMERMHRHREIAKPHRAISRNGRALMSIAKVRNKVVQQSGGNGPPASGSADCPWAFSDIATMA